MIEGIVPDSWFLAAQLAFLAAAWGWFIRTGRILNPTRRMLFLYGLAAATVAYLTQFFLQRYVRHAHLNVTPEVDVVVWVMLFATLAGFVTSWFGRSYGRAFGCLASLLIFARWWVIRMSVLWMRRQ